MKKLVELPADNTVAYRHVPSGITFIGYGAFVDIYPPEQWFTKDIIMAPEITKLLKVEGVRVRIMHADHEQDFFVCDEKHVLTIQPLFREHFDAVIVVSPEWFKADQATKHQAYLDDWASSPDRMGS